MQRYKCKIAYDGTLFSGYQVQPDKRTIQGEIERALQRLHKGGAVKIYASGRTDAGVHARGQMIHFDSPLSIPTEKWGIALNALLPEDIAIVRVERAEADFHARYSAVGKEYRYFIYMSSARDPLRRQYAYHFPSPLDIPAMEEAKGYLIGTHDFTSFCSAKTEVEDRVREIKQIDISVNDEEKTMCFRFVGNGFLYNMVRIIVGTLLHVGSGQIAPNAIKEILERKDRTFAGKTAPPHGLYLWEVFYK